jgi:hypothetical protein
MSLPYIESRHTTLRQAGYDEQWLQDLIHKDPSLLRLGDLKSLAREVKQSSGGRLDLLMTDPESEIMYEVEVMLGATDESHIIRTIEYWDIESRRRPDKEHRAVIIAEEITNRFFNVIWILSRSIPIVAIKLDALEIDGKLALSFTKVLDLYETPEVEETPTNSTTRQSWIDYSSKESFAVFDKMVELFSKPGKTPRITYNADHIAVGGSKRNCAWFGTRKSPHCMVELRVGESNLDQVIQELNDAKINAYRYSASVVRFRLTMAELTSQSQSIQKAVDFAVREGDGI